MAFIDDAVAHPDRLNRLLDVQLCCAADVVSGPVLQRYETGAELI